MLRERDIENNQDLDVEMMVGFRAIVYYPKDEFEINIIPLKEIPALPKTAPKVT